MKVDIFTLFPEMFHGSLNHSILKRAIAKDLLDVRLHNIRDYAHDSHRTTDDYPYGGGPGMVMKAEPMFEAVQATLGMPSPDIPIILLTPQGVRFTQQKAERLAQEPSLAFLCGHYQGVDERIRLHLATEEVSIGDYVLTGGEMAALVVVDAVARLLPGVLGSDEAAAADSHANGVLQHAQYTRPAQFRGWEVPPVLLSGDHAQIAAWRREQSLRRTWKRRPDLLQREALSQEEQRLLERLGWSDNDGTA